MTGRRPPERLVGRRAGGQDRDRRRSSVGLPDRRRRRSRTRHRARRPSASALRRHARQQGRADARAHVRRARATSRCGRTSAASARPRACTITATARPRISCASWTGPSSRFGPLPVVLAGFSFGAFVQTRVAKRVAGGTALVLVGVAGRPRHRRAQLPDRSRPARHRRDPRRARRDRAARERARLGAAAGAAGGGDSGRGPLLPPAAAPHPRHRQAPVESLTATQVLRVTGLRKRTAAPRSSPARTSPSRAASASACSGPNGAGKTTTLRLCLGLIDPDGGDDRADGATGAGRGARRRASASASCRRMDNLDPDFTVAENLLVYGRYFGLARRRDRSAHSATCSSSPDLAGRGGRRDPDALRRHEAPPHARARARERPGAHVHRRADDRARSAGAAPHLGAAAQPARAGQDDPAHDALHGRGRAALRPARDHGPAAGSSPKGRRASSIAEHIEPEVVEVLRRGRAPSGPRARRRGSPSRVERVGETAFCYAARRAARSSPTSRRRGALATCTGRRTSRTCFSSSPGGNCVIERGLRSE